MRQLTSIRKISKLEPIEGADQIEVATILGWHCVVKKGEFKEGDWVIYCEIDSFLPIKPEFEFLRKSCYKKLSDETEGFRIKTIRLRGQISQGIVFPLDILPRGITIAEGDDVSELLGIIKYDPPLPANLAGTAKGNFPNFIPKTDEIRCQILQKELTQLKGTKCYISEKLDGSSVTYYVKDGIFGVCSRNLDLLETENNSYWKFARENNIPEKLMNVGKNIAIQGEIIGEGINSNPLKQKGVKVFFFQAFDIDKYIYYDFEEFVQFIKSLGLDTVPILDIDYKLEDNIDNLVELSKGKSQLNKDKDREGIVIRPLKEQKARGFDNERVSLKAINPLFLLKSEQ